MSNHNLKSDQHIEVISTEVDIDGVMYIHICAILYVTDYVCSLEVTTASVHKPKIVHEHFILSKGIRLYDSSSE